MRISWNDLRIDTVSGEGHSAKVFRAHVINERIAAKIGGVVAVKVYKDWVLSEPGQLERFLREIDLGRRVSHPNVVRIMGGVLDDRGRPALVMEYCDGPTLEFIVGQHRRQAAVMPITQAFSYLRDLAGAISALHSVGITHRDIKPANVLATERGLILSDFGVIRSADLPEQTTASEFLGTIRYAAPEYLFGEEYDSSVDVYAFGAIAYELFTSRMIFGAGAHWAKLIASKRSSPGYNENDLMPIADEHGWNINFFARDILKLSLCNRRARTLNLALLANILSERISDDSILFREREWPSSWNLGRQS